MLSNIKYTKPDFNDEFDELQRFRELQRMDKDTWVKLGKTGKVISYDEIKDKLSNIDLDFDKLDDDKKSHFEQHFKEGKIELPIVLKFDDEYELLGGNTRLAGLLKNKIKPKLWLIDMKNKLNEQNENNNIDTITVDVPLFIRMLEFAKEDAKTDMELHTATEKILELLKQNSKLSMDNYDTIVGSKKKQETNEMDASSSGSFEAPMTMIKKKDLYKPKEQDVNEVTAGVDGSFDVPLFGGTKGRKNPLSIGGEKTIGARAGKIEHTKSFPKFGGPDAKFVTINPKCKKFPYCNQGDPKAISIHEDKELQESIKEISKKYGIPAKELEQIVINEIKQIFI